MKEEVRQLEKRIAKANTLEELQAEMDDPYFKEAFHG